MIYFGIFTIPLKIQKIFRRRQAALGHRAD